MDILILGSNGQVGRALISELRSNYNVSFLDRRFLDVTNFDKLRKYFKNKEFQFVFNAVAYTNVDEAENNRELCKLTNDDLTYELSLLSDIYGFKIIHYSTDYVFDGQKKSKYLETDKTNPLNYYGHTKLCGEDNIRNNCKDYLILRTSGVYSSQKNNFLFKIKEKLYTHNEIFVVEDQIVNQTSSLLIAKLSHACLKNFNFLNKNILNVVPSSSLSWYEFANLIKSRYNRQKKIICKVKPIMTSDLDQIAMRPLNSALDNKKIKEMLKIQIDSIENSFMNDVI